MNRFYVTFGSGHQRSLDGVELHPDMALEVIAETETDARTLAVETIGNKWAFIYTASDFDISYHPQGVTAALVRGPLGHPILKLRFPILLPGRSS